MTDSELRLYRQLCDVADGRKLRICLTSKGKRGAQGHVLDQLQVRNVSRTVLHREDLAGVHSVGRAARFLLGRLGVSPVG